MLYQKYFYHMVFSRFFVYSFVSSFLLNLKHAKKIKIVSAHCTLYSSAFYLVHQTKMRLQQFFDTAPYIPVRLMVAKSR